MAGFHGKLKADGLGRGMHRRKRAILAPPPVESHLTEFCRFGTCQVTVLGNGCERYGTRSPEQSDDYEVGPFAAGGGVVKTTDRRRRALVMTETELRLIAAAATIGLRSSPNAG